MTDYIANGLALGAIGVRSWQSSWIVLESDWPNERLQPHLINVGIPIGLS